MMTSYDGENIETYDFGDWTNAVNLMVDAREELEQQFYTLAEVAILPPWGIPKAEIDTYGNKAALAARDMFRYRMATITGEPEDPATDMAKYIKSLPLPPSRKTHTQDVAKALRLGLDTWVYNLVEGDCDPTSMDGAYTAILNLIKDAHSYALEAQGYLKLDSKKGA